MVSLSKSRELLDPAQPLRFRFRKVGALQYISHLDLVRTLTKVVVRAGIPVWYTEGFNPKPRLSFATPMSVGLESTCEFMDLKVVHPVDPGEVLAAFNRNVTPECAAEEVYVPEHKFTEIAYSSYEFRIHTAGAGAPLAASCERLLREGPAVVTKRSKSGDKPVDICPYIREISVAAEGEDLVLRAVIEASGDRFLNPEYVVTALKTELGILSGSPLAEWYGIRRTGVYFADMAPFR